MNYPTQNSGKRIAMLDIARFYGIALVYYGHIIERIMYLKNPVAAAHYKFIYSFHMLLFFILAGYVASKTKLQLPVGKFLKQLALSRLLPYVFFCLLLTVLSLFFKGDFFLVDVTSVKGYFDACLRAMLGFPVLNIPMWFLACLFTVEVLHYFASKVLNTNTRMLWGALALYLLGYYLTRDFNFIYKDRIFQWNYWFIHEAPVVYAFYLVGVYLRRRNFLLGAARPGRLAAAIVICLLTVLYTFNLNTGPFKIFDAVVIVLSGHGNVFLFPFTAFAGSLMIIMLARISGEARWLCFMGQNALILFALNGIFYHFLNGPFAAWFAETFSGSALSVTAAGVAFAAVSLLCCVPVVLLFKRFIPQLMGRPGIDGPIIGRLV